MEVDLPSSYIVTNVMVLDINILYLSMIDEIVYKYNWFLIVTFEWDNFEQAKEVYWGDFQGHAFIIFFLLASKICFNFLCIFASFCDFDLGVLIIGE